MKYRSKEIIEAFKVGDEITDELKKFVDNHPIERLKNGHFHVRFHGVWKLFSPNRWIYKENAYGRLFLSVHYDFKDDKFGLSDEQFKENWEQVDENDQ